MLEKQPNRTNIHIEGVVPLFFGYLLGVSNVQDPSVVQQKVYSANVAHGLVYQSTGFARFGTVSWNRKRWIANFVSNLLNAIPSPAD
jgi:hypothetical protein